jgi:hypothetical protein
MRPHRPAALWSIPVCCLLACLLAAAGGCRNGPEPGFHECLSCHEGIESAGPGHDFGCAACHLLSEDRDRPLHDHQPILDNPAGPEASGQICAPCHQEAMAAFQTGLHMSLAGMINQTRYLFGAQTRASPPIYGAGGTLAPLPQSPAEPERPAELVDDLLRRKCLRCHPDAAGSESRPPYRGRGCAACHVLYAPDGRYHGRDRSLDRNSTGHPRVHGLTAAIPDSQCLKCHRPNYVGSDAHGLFERDYDSFFQEAALGAEAAEDKPWGPFHRLAGDLHVERGLGCLDCHGQADVMGDGRQAGFALQSPGTRCQDCHGGFASPEPDTRVPGIARHNGTWTFTDRDGRRRRLPLFSPNSPSHDPAVHSRLRCSACHARWTGHDYGLSLQRQDGGDFRVWTYLTGQGDPGLESKLERLLANPKRPPRSVDLLSGEMEQGLWLKGYRFRRWEHLVLGLDHRGRISLMRPLHQYRVSFVDSRGRVRLDSVIPRRTDGGPGWAFMPFVPHTTGPRGRPCQTCHGSSLAAGLGLDWSKDLDSGPDFELLRPSPPAVAAMRLLNQAERSRLLDPGSGFATKTFQRRRILLQAGDHEAKTWPEQDGLPENTAGPRLRSQNRTEQKAP